MNKKKFKIAFTVAFIAFLSVYIAAIVKDIKTDKEAPQPNTNTVDVVAKIDSKKDKSKTKSKKSEDKPDELINDKYIFLLYGTDSHNIDISNGYRSDTMILTSVDFKDGSINMVSLPRDTYVKIQGHGNQKLNHAHSYGGSDLLLQTVSENFNVYVNHFIKVDYMLVQRLVDSLGGIEVDVPIDMVYYDPSDTPPLNINIKKGPQRLNGPDSVKFLRFRNDGKGDIGRVERQQLFLKEFFNEALRLRNIGMAPKLFAELKSNIRTNFSERQVLDALLSLSKINTDKISMQTLPGEATIIDGISYWVLNDKDSKEMLEKNFKEYIKTDIN